MANPIARNNSIIIFLSPITFPTSYGYSVPNSGHAFPSDEYNLLKLIHAFLFLLYNYNVCFKMLIFSIFEA